MSGFITLQRQLLEWEWYKDTKTKSLFIHCLLKANWEDKQWKGENIKRGQFITSINSLSSELNMSVKEIRNAIVKLEKTNEIIKKGANKFTLLTVVKYEFYQELNSTGANKGQTKGKQRATTNNNNNITTNNTIDNRKLEFAHTLKEFNSIYSRDMLKEFYEYWTETNEGGIKFRREMQKTWDLSRRLKKWQSNNTKFKSNGKSKITDTNEFKQITNAIRSESSKY